MRTKLTLWRILDKYLNEHFKSGICGYLERLQLYEIITFKESASLKKEIRSLYPDRLSFSGYYIGAPGDKEPRKKLIRNRIEYYVYMYVYMYVLYFFSGMAIIIGLIGILLDDYTDIDLSIVYGILLFLFVYAITGMIYVNTVTKIIIKLWKF